MKCRVQYILNGLVAHKHITARGTSITATVKEVLYNLLLLQISYRTYLHFFARVQLPLIST